MISTAHCSPSGRASGGIRTAGRLYGYGSRRNTAARQEAAAVLGGRCRRTRRSTFGTKALPPSAPSVARLGPRLGSSGRPSRRASALVSVPGLGRRVTDRKSSAASAQASSTVSSNPPGDLPTSPQSTDRAGALRQHVHRLAAAVITTAGGEATQGACRAVESSLREVRQREMGEAAKSLSLLSLARSETDTYLEDAAVLLYSVANVEGDMLLAEGGLQALMDIVRVPVGNGAAGWCRGYAVAALAQLFASQPQSASAFVEAGGIPMLVRVLIGLPEEDHDTKRVVLDAVLKLLDGKRRAAAAVAAAESGLVPILLELMRKSDEETLAVQASDILEEMASVKECSHLLLGQRVVDNMVWIIENRTRDVRVRCKAIVVIHQFACSREVGIMKIVAVSSSRCLVQVLWHGDPAEVVVAEKAVLEIALAPIGARYMYLAGLVPAICGTIVVAESVQDQHRAIKLIQCIIKSHEALEDLMQPTILGALAECLKSERDDTQYLVCSTVMLLLRQCPSSMASRAQRLVPLLVTVLRKSSSTPCCRAAVFCILRLCQEPAVTELMLASGMLSVVDRLVSSPANVEFCSWGLMITQQLSSKSQRAGRFFARKAGLVRKFTALLDTTLSLQAISTLSALSVYSHAIEELVALDAQEKIASAIADKGGSSHVATVDEYRCICLASDLLARLLSSPESNAVSPQLAVRCIPILVEALTHPLPEIPLYVSDVAALRSGRREGLIPMNGPNRVLLDMASECQDNKSLMLEEMAFQVWNGRRSTVHGVDLI